MQNLPPALAALSAYNQFVCWVPVKNEKGKWDKIPIDAITGDPCSVVDPKHQYSFETAAGQALRHGGGVGVGFAFTAKDPFFFLDIDNCFNPNTGEWSKTAYDVGNCFPGAAVEKSFSGTGMHIFGTYTTCPEHAKKNKALGLELYTEDRFVALTGIDAQGDITTDHTKLLGEVAAYYFPPKQYETETGWTDGPIPEWNGYKDDKDLIAAALKAKSTAATFGKAASFEDLWNNDTQKLVQFYGADGSLIDSALCTHLAFWTGNDCERMRRLMFQSALVRDKWDRDDYIQATILDAIRKQGTNVYSAGPTKFDLVTDHTGPQRIEEGSNYMSCAHLPEYFKGCAYVSRDNKIFSLELGQLLDKERFNVMYGGYMFGLATDNTKPTPEAWKAFTQSQAWRFPRVHRTCFKPRLPPGHIQERENKLEVNTYIPYSPKSHAGDVTPFLNHLKRLLPNQGDQNIVLAYMAAVVQNPGVKFRYAPVIQGVEGNGKSLLAEFLVYSLGLDYIHYPDSQDLGNKFNKWMVGNLLGVVEEIYVPSHRAEIQERLKVWITGDKLQVQGKGADQLTVEICINYMFFTNYQDAVRKTQNDRRFAVFYTAQQQFSDLARDGLTTEYFKKLLNWMHTEGYSAVHHHLKNYAIPAELNPADSALRAPITSVHAEAIAASKGWIEAEIENAISEERYGFAGGWISSMALSQLLKEIKGDRALPLRKRGEVLAQLGYQLHPGLKDGKIGATIQRESGRPKLYVSATNPAQHLTDGAAIKDAYEKAQSGGTQAAFAIVQNTGG